MIEAVSVVMLASCMVNVSPVETKFMQVCPTTQGNVPARSPGQSRAVVLIHGLHPTIDVQAVNEATSSFKLLAFLASAKFGPKERNPAQADFQPWQMPDSALVRACGRHADVYSYAYGQNAPLLAIVESGVLEKEIVQLKKLGYTDIVLLGHSAGAVLARFFVENHPESAVTKVIQVCPPNGGCAAAKAYKYVHAGQKAFVASLGVDAMEECCKRRAKTIPATLQFLCVVNTHGNFGDFVVPCVCQWPEDLQAQGIPVVKMHHFHFTVMKSDEAAQTLSDLLPRSFSRVSAREVGLLRESFRQSLSGDDGSSTYHDAFRIR